MARTPARLPSGARLSDHVTLGVLTATVPAGLIDAVLADTGRQSRRQRRLPARLVVYYVMALALYAQASYGEVLRCLLEGVRWLRLAGADPALAGKSAITRARARLGADPLRELFARVARPLAAPWPVSRPWRCWPKDRCMPCRPTTCRRSAPLYTRPLVLRPEPSRAGPQLVRTQPTQRNRCARTCER